jgi:hypothetical protein
MPVDMPQDMLGMAHVFNVNETEVRRSFRSILDIFSPFCSKGEAQSETEAKMLQ